MSKYAPLAEYLKKQSGPKKSPVEVSFRKLEEELGFKLPKSAYKQRAWWSNNIHNNVMTRVWRNAGFCTENVDMAEEKVVFRNKQEPMASAIERMLENDIGRRRSKTDRHPIRGSLKGTLRLVGGTDLTKPADPDWASK